jgi:hypothetical protein
MALPSSVKTAGRRGAGLLLLAVLVVAAAIFMMLVVASYARSPNLSGLLGGVFGGFFTALLFAGAGAWGVLWLVRERKDAAEADPQAAGELEDLLGATLRDLEALRLEVVRKIRAKAMWMAPLGVAAGAALWIAGQFGDDPPDVVDLLVFCGGGGVVGYVWASMKLGAEYRRRYKDMVLPKLASRFDPGLSYCEPRGLDVERLRRHRVFRQFDAANADDEIAGHYRGLPLSIVELELTYGSGKNRRTIFNGLLTEVTLPRGLRGTTAVIADAGMFGNLTDRFKANGCERVRLEDPRFEAIYEVYGSDQIAARALLTPAFIERFMALELTHFGRPMALAEDNRLMLAMPKRSGRNLFEPPSYNKPAATRAALVELSNDIATVLKAADAVIDLDFAARGSAAAKP